MDETEQILLDAQRVRVNALIEKVGPILDGNTIDDIANVLAALTARIAADQDTPAEAREQLEFSQSLTNSYFEMFMAQPKQEPS